MTRAADVATPGAVGSMVPVAHTVVGAWAETPTTVTLAVRPVAGEPVPFAAGQVSMLYAFGVGEVPISISSDPGNPAVQWYTIRRAGAVTAALCDLRPGDVLGVRGPFGVPWPLGAAAGGDVLIMAGGIGLAPLRSAVVDLLSRRRDFRRAIVLYGAKSPSELVFGTDLRAWRDRLDLELALTVDTPGPGWVGATGLVTDLIPADLDPRRTTALLCGPEAMMRATLDALATRGLARTRIWVSMERNMLCGVGLCGHCQLGPFLVCVHGPVLRADRVAPYLEVAQL
jgi:NAD(P)H-flavin reductase